MEIHIDNLLIYSVRIDENDHQQLVTNKIEENSLTYQVAENAKLI